MDPMISLGQKNTHAEYMILSGADNRPPMLDKDLYDYWKSRMELYMQNREHERMILELVEHGPLIWPTVEENSVIRTKKYAELSAAEKIQADCDMKATNIILQGIPADIYSLVNHHRVAKDLWERVQLLMQGTSLTKQEREYAGFAVLVFSPGDDPIACLNKAMAFFRLFRENKGKIIPVILLRAMLLVQGEIPQVDRQELLNATTAKVKDIWLGNALSQSDQGMQHGIPASQTLTVIPHNAAFQTKDLDTYDSDCDDLSTAQAVLMANISNYGSDVISEVVQIVLWYLDSGCSKHMTGDRSQLMNFVSKFLGTVRFGNDQIAWIMGYVAFRKNTCFIRNLEGADLLSGSRNTNLYTISLDDMLKSSLICLLSKASKTKSWLWHRRLSHLNFGTLNKLVKDGLARGIPRLKFQKDHLCSACALGKSKKTSHQPKAEDTNQEKLYLLHMDLCGPMRVASIKGKRYILVIVDDYLRFTWTLREWYENVGILHQISVAHTSQQNGVVERQNRTLVEAARTMLIFSKAPLFLQAEAINTSCYTPNRSLICIQYNKTPYELMQDKKSNLSFFHIFGSLCYPTNDHEDLGKFDAKADIGIFVGYAPAKKAFRIYNRRTQLITETIHVTFDELTTMASEQFSSGLGLHYMTHGISSTRLGSNPDS
ncbi:retrovirus-related pol polyprotein from transposon TNT 1-94 [Tanacetum coccineum]